MRLYPKSWIYLQYSKNKIPEAKDWQSDPEIWHIHKGSKMVIKASFEVHIIILISLLTTTLLVAE